MAQRYYCYFPITTSPATNSTVTTPELIASVLINMSIYGHGHASQPSIIENSSMSAAPITSLQTQQNRHVKYERESVAKTAVILENQEFGLAVKKVIRFASYLDEHGWS